jgi:superfamily II DNA helicase RecQ
MKERYMDSIPLTFTTASVSEYSINLIANSFGLNMQKHSRDAVQDSKMLSLSERAKQLMLIQQLKDRPNLHISVIDKKNINVANLIASKTQQKTTIVYCLTRKEAEKLCLELIELGYHAGVYHGGMTYKRREHIQKQWMGGHISIVCATSAFGVSN